jgi:xylan 1,4-beta-xylosidase
MRLLSRLCILGILLMSTLSQAAPDHGLLPNGGFEREAGGNPIGWQSLWGKDGSVTWVNDVVHAGEHAVRLTGNACYASDPLPNTGDVITVSGWLKTENMTLGKKPWLKASIVVLKLDANRKATAHHDIARILGTTDWTHYSRTFSLPESVPYYQVTLQYGEDCTGTMWGDDLSVTTARDPYAEPPRKLDREKAVVTVDTTQDAGLLPDLWRHIDQSYLANITVPRRAETIPAFHRAGFRYIRFHECIVGPKIYREVDGKPAYNWTVFDQGLRTLLDNGLKPMLVLESTPTPIAGKRGQTFRNINPPVDFAKWEELIYQLVRHCVATYGAEEVRTWYFEVWNEPDAKAYFLGDLAQLVRIYDHTVAGATRAFPDVRIGGPGGAGNGWVLPLVEHCANGRNSATGGTGAKLDFISWHIYCSGTGTPDFRVIRRSILQVDDHRRKFPKFAKLPRFITEFSCNSSPAPWLDDSYRAPFLLRALLTMDQLGIEQAYSFCVGDYLWAKDDQVFRRALGMFTNPGFPKAPFHLYTLLDRLPGHRVKAASSNAPVDVLAGYDPAQQQLGVILGNWVEDPASDFTTQTTLRLHCPAWAGRTTKARLVRVDREHSNAFDDWQRLGSPQITRAKLADYRAGKRDTPRQQEVATLIATLTAAARLDSGADLSLTFDAAGDAETTIPLPVFGLVSLHIQAAD